MSDTMIADGGVAHRSTSMLLRILEAFAEPAQPDTLLHRVDQVLASTIGHRLFTALLYRPEREAARRIYTSRPGAFAASGEKSLERAPTMRRVLTTGTPYLGNGVAAIARDFPDAEAIFALDCASVLNMPVRWNGAVLGQINLLHADGHYRPEHLPVIESIAQIVVPAFLAATADVKEDGQ